MAKTKTEKQDGVLTAELTFGERISLLELLPPEGTIVTVRLVRELREKLTASEKELKELNVVIDSTKGTLRWDADMERKRRFSFSGYSLKLIVERLQKLEKDEKLTERHLPLWDKFVTGTPVEQAAGAAAGDD